jgi:hypothetical protein
MGGAGSMERSSFGSIEEEPVSVFEVGTEPRTLSLPFERPGGAPGLRARARVALTPGSVHRIEIEATVPPGEGFEPDEHPLVVGLAGERLVAVQVERAGTRRSYQVAVDVHEPRAAELTVWAPRPLLDAGIRIEAVGLIRWEAAASRIRVEKRRVVAGEEERLVEVLPPGGHRLVAVEVSNLAQRLRLGWTALGPPEATTTLAVRARGRHGEQSWVGVRQPREGFAEVEIDLGPLGRGLVEIEVEVDGEVGAGLARHQLVGAGSGNRPRVVVVVLERLPQGALDPLGPMPRLREQLGTMQVVALAPFPVEITPLLGSLLTGADPLGHALGYGQPAGPLELPMRVEAAGGHSWAWTERHLADGLPVGFGRWLRYAGGWPRQAPLRLLRDLTLSLVDDPPPGTLALAAVSAGPPWPWQEEEVLALSSSRPAPQFQVREQLRWNRTGKSADAIEAAAVAAAVAAQLDQALAEVWGALQNAAEPWSVVIVGADVGGEAGFAAVETSFDLPDHPFSSLEAWGDALASGVGLPRRGEEAAPAGRIGVAATGFGVSEQLDRSGRVVGWDGDGRGAWLEVLPWGAPAPRLGGEALVARRLQRYAAAQLAGSRLDIDPGAQRMSLILRGSGLGPDRIFVVDGGVEGRVAEGGRRVELELAASQRARVILSPRAGSPVLEIEGLAVECGRSAWVIERGSSGSLQQHSQPVGGAIVVAYRPVS